MKAMLWMINILAWPAIQLGVARWMLMRPSAQFQHDTWITRQRTWEQSGRIYRRVLIVHRWKKFLPDAAPWLSNLPRKQLTTRSPAQAAFLLTEMRRAELAHWYMLACTPVLFSWNPPWACGVMLLYGVAANMPCIIAQRYNRTRLARFVAPRTSLYAGGEGKLLDPAPDSAAGMPPADL